MAIYVEPNTFNAVTECSADEYREDTSPNLSPLAINHVGV